ncbi:MAG: hypothetical protein Q9217_002851 [Psora testacea]
MSADIVDKPVEAVENQEGTSNQASLDLEHFAYSTPTSPSKGRTRPTTRNAKISLTANLLSPQRKRKEPPSKSSPSSSPSRKKRSSSGYAPPSKYSHLVNRLKDSLAPNLICVFIGLNPGIRTATLGHAYAHPSNLFWKLVHSSGCTPRLCRPEEDHDLPHLYALGHTNIVSRPTKDGSELSKEEMDAGVAILEDKIKRYRPESVCIVGKSIWESVWRVRHGKKISTAEFKYGWQDPTENMGVVRSRDKGGDDWEGTRVFVATTTSGLAAGMRPHEKQEVWRGLGEWVAKRRKDRGIPDEGGKKPKAERDQVKSVLDNLIIHQHIFGHLFYEINLLKLREMQRRYSLKGADFR